MGKRGEAGTVDGILLRIPIYSFSLVVVSFPAVSLAVCFITAFIFRFEDVNETMCEVKNFIPSISAVTGITPQTYLWRMGIALHSAPRFAVAYLYYNYYLQRLFFVSQDYQGWFKKLIWLNFWLNTIENLSLVGVTCVTNRENYPVHEKIFIVFMVTSLCYMLCNTICFKMCRGPTMTEDEQKSYFWKKAMFAGIMSATVGLIIFFIKHRFFCHPGAFSYFSICEYIIAYTNMGYHFTLCTDLKGQEWLFGTLTPLGAVNGMNNNNDSMGTVAQVDPVGTTIRRRRH